MVQLKDFISLSLTREDIEEALRKALSSGEVGINNLRYRQRTIILDCKIRGYIGEIALKKWFQQYKIEFEHSDFLDDNSNMDIDLLYRGREGRESYNFEVKTSLVPDAYQDMTGVVQRADIKIIKRSERVIENVTGDIHIQIYYDFLRKARDSQLKALDQSISDKDQIYSEMHLEEYIPNTYFVAWIDKPTLIEYINQLPEFARTWTFKNSARYFWKCPIREIAKKPVEIIDYINNNLL